MGKKENIGNRAGFTLLEILVAISIGAVIMGAIYVAYDNQQKAYVASDQVAAMQQNIRSALYIMGSQIREAGCNPTEKIFPVPGFVAAGPTSLQFTCDIAGNVTHPNQSDGDTDDANENITFTLSGSTITRTDNNTPPATPQDIADGITNLEFNYILKDNSTTTAPTASQLSEIRAVQISILARARIPSKLLNSTTYTTASGATWGPFNDYYRRRFASTTIQCRNMGL